MAFKHGKNSEVLLDGADISAYLDSVDVASSTEHADVTTFKQSWKKVIPGLNTSSVSATGYFDTAESPIMLATLQAATPNVLTVAPAGNLAIGDLQILFPVDASTYKESAKLGGAVSFNWAAESTGIVGYGYSLHTLSVDNGTTTGAFHDDLAQTTTGGILHLNVTAVSSGSWVVKLQDCATSGGSYVDVAGATFAAVTVPGALRLVVPGTIRQFVKYVATVTGGSTPTITFALGFART